MIKRCFLGLLLAAPLVACGEGEEPHGEGEALVSMETPDGALDIQVWSAPQPPAKGLADLAIEVHTQEGGAPVEGLTIEVIPWMGAHGHGSNEVMGQEVGEGAYRAEGVLFNMPGPWELRLEISGAWSGSVTSDSFEVLP